MTHQTYQIELKSNEYGLRNKIFINKYINIAINQLNINNQIYEYKFLGKYEIKKYLFYCLPQMKKS